MKIFLIDDNNIDLLISHKLLIKYDSTIEVQEFGQARKAAALLQEGKEENMPDLILLDLNMPGMNGWEFLEAIKSIPHRPVVYILTSSLDERDKSMSAQYEIVKGYITKPLNNASISQALSHFA